MNKGRVFGHCLGRTKNKVHTLKRLALPNSSHDLHSNAATRHRNLQHCIFYNMIERLQQRDMMRMYNNLVERCFTDCIDSFRRKSLDKQEETCVRRCTEKFLRHSMRVGKRFGELNQGAATQD